MEENKLDIKSIIGFVLIFGILIYMFYQNQPTPEELEAQKAEQEQVEAQKNKVEEEAEKVPVLEAKTIDPNDSTAVAQYKSTVGAFGYTKTLEGTTILENEVLKLESSNSQFKSRFDNNKLSSFMRIEFSFKLCFFK